MATLTRADLSRLLDALPDAALLIDGEGTVLTGNSAACALLDYSLDALRRQSLSRFVAERRSDEDRAFVVEAFTAPEGLAETPVVLRLRRRDGSEVWVQATRRVLTVGRSRLMLAVMRVAVSTAFVRKLVAVGESLRQADSRSGLIQRLFEGVRDLSGATGAVLVVKLPDEDSIFVEEAWGLMSEFAGRRLPFVGSVSSTVLATGQPYVTHDPAELPNLSEGQFPTEVGGLAFVPLLADPRVPGVLGVVKHARFDEGEVERLRVLADIGGAWLQQMALHEDLVEREVAAADDYEEMINAWATALDRREGIGEGHSQRVSELTVRIAKAMGVDREELPHIRRGALLHDVGKMLVPEYVLTKQGPLDAQERTLVRKHPEYAYDILGSIGFLRRALAIPSFHHERWDGTGYPRGLDGESIPVAARVLAVADVYETLMTARAYGPAMTSEEALSYIVDQSGTQFCPRAVEALVAIVSPAGEPPST